MDSGKSPILLVAAKKIKRGGEEGLRPILHCVRLECVSLVGTWLNLIYHVSLCDNVVMFYKMCVFVNNLIINWVLTLS